MLEFIHKLKKVRLVVDNTKLDNAIASTSFKKMQNLEKEKGFIESKIDNKTGKNIPFFNLGENNKWEKSLNSEIVKKIENAFGKEMKELGYL